MERYYCRFVDPKSKDKCSKAFSANNRNENTLTGGTSTNVHDQLRKAQSVTESHDKYPHKAAHMAHTRLIAGLGLSVRQGCHQLFRNHVQAVRDDLSYCVSSETVMKTKHIPALTAISKQAVDALIASSAAYSLSFDIWSKFNRGFISITANCVTPAFKRSNHSCGLFEFSSEHTGINIISKLKDSIAQFQIQFKNVVALTHDAARNNHSKKSLEATPGTIKSYAQYTRRRMSPSFL